MSQFVVLSRSVVGFYLGVAGCAAGAAGPPVGPPLPLNSALVTALGEEMRTNNPALRGASARVTAATAEVDSVRSWEDPVVMVGGQFAETAMRADEGDLLYGVEQPLPLFGKPARRRAVARASLGAEQAAEVARFQEARRDLAQSLFRAAYSQRAVEVGAEDLRWLEATVATTEQRYQVGEAPQVYLLRLQNERARRRDQLRTDQLRVLEDLASVNRLLGRPIDSAWPRLELPAPAGAVPYTDRIVELALANEPRLEVLRQQVQVAEAAVAATRRERLPEVALGAEGRNYTGDGDFRQAMVRLSISLPWINDGKYRQDIRRETARRQAAEFDVADQELAIREEVRRLTAGLDSARREALLFRDEIVPRSVQALGSAEASWAANRAMFLDVMEARRMLIDARLTYARAVADQYRMLSDLVLCCGLGDLDALSMIGAQPPDDEPAPPEKPSARREAPAP